MPLMLHLASGTFTASVIRTHGKHHLDTQIVRTLWRWLE